MKHKNALILILCFFYATTSFAQKDKMTREEKDEKSQARTARINNKNDYTVFHRQILSLKEYLDERKKIPALQKTNKTPVKVVAVVDSLDDADEDAKSTTLTGYIRQDIGDNSTNIYDIVFDRAQKKIISVKLTPEAAEANKEDATDKEEKATTAKTKDKAFHKKNKDDDDDDDADEDKPVKAKSKQRSRDDDD